MEIKSIDINNDWDINESDIKYLSNILNSIDSIKRDKMISNLSLFFLNSFLEKKDIENINKFKKLLEIQLYNSNNDLYLRNILDSIFKIKIDKDNKDNKDKTPDLLKYWLSNTDSTIIINRLSSTTIDRLISINFDFKILINNFKLLDKFWIYFQNYTDDELNDYIIKIYLENIDFSMKDAILLHEYLVIYWIDYKKYIEVKNNNKDHFDFFKNFNLRNDYVFNLAMNKFPFKEFLWKENLLTDKNIYFIVSLFNKKIPVKDIISYIEIFWDKFSAQKENDIYIESIHKQIWWDTKMLKKFINEKQVAQSPSDLYDLLNYWTIVNNEVDKVSTYKKDFNWKLDKYSNSDIYNYLISNDIKAEYILSFLDNKFNFNINDLLFLWNQSNWKWLNVSLENRAKIVFNYIELNNKFSWKDIMILLNRWLILDNNIDRFFANKDIIKQFLSINSNFSWLDIANLAIKFFNEKPDWTRDYLPNNAELESINKYKKIFWNNLSWDSIISLINFETWGWDILKLKKDSSTLKNISKLYSIDEIITILTFKNFSLEDLINNLGYKNFKDQDIKKANLNWVKISDYNSLIQNNNSSSTIKNMTLNFYIDLKNSWFKDTSIADIWNEYLELDIKISNTEKNYQFEKNISELAKKWLNELLDFIRLNQWKTIEIWAKNIPLKWNLQLLNWIISHLNENIISSLDDIWKEKLITNFSKLDWNKVISSYESVLSDYIDVKENIDTVFFMAWNHYYWEDSWNLQYKNKNILKWIFQNTNFYDYSTWTELWEWLDKSNKLLNIIEKYLEENPDKNILVYIWLHWDISWNAWTSKWNLKKSDFDKLNEFSSKYKNLKINIDSCNNSSKFSNTLNGDILSNSWDFYSVSNYSDYLKDINMMMPDWFMNWDINKDWIVTSREINIYLSTTYQSWIVYFGSSFKGKKWNTISLTKDLLLLE